MSKRVKCSNPAILEERKIRNLAKAREYGKINRAKITAARRDVLAAMSPEERRERYKRDYHKYKERRKAYNKQYLMVEKNKEHKKNYNKKWSQDNAERLRYRKIFLNYGITKEQYDDMLRSQRNRCKLCKLEFGDQTPYLDHDHLTGEFRGLLHSSCNILIGHAYESPILLELAAEYLKTCATNPTGVMTNLRWELKT